MDFYDNIAGFYDDMTGSGRRSDRVRLFISGICSGREVRSALDVACGTGAHSLEMARAGIAVTGADISDKMLGQARAAADELALDIEFINCPMQEMAGAVDGRSDLILCMGNSLPHVLGDDECYGTLSGFYELLRPGGQVFIHMLNFPLLIENDRRVIGINGDVNQEYIRFYDFVTDEPDLINFNLLRITRKGDKAGHELETVKMRPWSFATIREYLEQIGFVDIELFGDLAFGSFNPEVSQAVVIKAGRE